MKVKKYQPTLSLKPTQFSIGVAEVETRVREWHEMKKKDLKKELDLVAVPVVISPWRELCIIDHHHFVFACWHANVHAVKVEVVEDFSESKLNYLSFWKKMAKLNYAYLYDQFGDGPRNPLYLPDDVRGMADDPYRTLAWSVRKGGGCEKSDEKFAEFRWADFFRKRGLLNKQGRRGLIEAIPKALKLARSRAANGLPGYIGSLKAKKDVSHSKARKTIPKPATKGALATIPALNKSSVKIAKKHR